MFWQCFKRYIDLGKSWPVQRSLYTEPNCFMKISHQDVLSLITAVTLTFDPITCGLPKPFLAQLMSCKLKLSLCDHPLSGVRPSFRPSVVNIGWTNLDGKTYRVHIGSVDTLGGWLLPILKLGHSYLLCGFYRAKFTNVFQWEQDWLIFWRLFTTRSFSICKMIIPTMTSDPY